MAVSPDLNFQNFSTVQNSTQPAPNTIDSTTTIAPSTFVTLVSGTAAIATVTPPITGQHMLVLVPAAAFTTVTTGNLVSATTAVANVPILLIYNPALAKYYVKNVG